MNVLEAGIAEGEGGGRERGTAGAGAEGKRGRAGDWKRHVPNDIASLPARYRLRAMIGG